jgi:hypothetical protein
MQRFLPFFLSCSLPLSGHAFVTTSFSSKSLVIDLPSSSQKTTTRRKMSPELVEVWNHALDGFHQAQFLLADASAAAVEESVSKNQEGGGLWQQYLNIFKGTLIFIHSAIDDPLRSVGITQTWGISIALFTISESSTSCQRLCCQ